MATRFSMSSVASISSWEHLSLSCSPHRLCKEMSALSRGSAPWLKRQRRQASMPNKFSPLHPASERWNPTITKACRGSSCSLSPQWEQCRINKPLGMLMSGPKSGPKMVVIAWQIACTDVWQNMCFQPKGMLESPFARSSRIQGESASHRPQTSTSAPWNRFSFLKKESAALGAHEVWDFRIAIISWSRTVWPRSLT